MEHVAHHHGVKVALLVIELCALWLHVYAGVEVDGVGDISHTQVD